MCDQRSVTNGRQVIIDGFSIISGIGGRRTHFGVSEFPLLLSVTPPSFVRGR